MLLNRVLCGLLVVFLSAIGANQAVADKKFVDLLKHIRPAVVIIESFDQQHKTIGKGSGFFINDKGYVITSNHVIDKAHSVSVKTIDGKTYSVTGLLASNARDDVAKLLIDIQNDKITPLSLSGTSPEIGEDIFVIGNPSGLESTVSKGIVSAYRQAPGEGSVMQITAPISPGSSGSPVMNHSGHVVGIVTAIQISGQSLNFAMPSQTILALKDFNKPVSFVEYTEKQQRVKAKEAKENAKTSLKGLKGVGIIISDLLPPELPKHPLYQLANDLLAKNNIKVYSHQELLQTPGKPHLYIEINSVKSANLKVCSVNCHVSLRQDVVLVRDQSIKVDTIDTWSSGGLAIIRPEQITMAVTTKVNQCIELFITELKEK